MVRRKFINTNGLRLYAFFTTVPIGSPSTILHKFPGVSMSNTTMGRFVLFAHGEGGQVHHFELTVVYFVES